MGISKNVKNKVKSTKTKVTTARQELNDAIASSNKTNSAAQSYQETEKSEKKNNSGTSAKKSTGTYTAPQTATAEDAATDGEYNVVGRDSGHEGNDHYLCPGHGRRGEGRRKIRRTEE